MVDDEQVVEPGKWVLGAMLSEQFGNGSAGAEHVVVSEHVGSTRLHKRFDSRAIATESQLQLRRVLAERVGKLEPAMHSDTVV